MTVSINGTSGIVNDATDLNYTGTLTGGTGVVNIGSGQVYKDASGNVGIGTSSPQNDTSYGGFTVNGANGSIITFRSGNVNSGRIYTSGTDHFNIDANGTNSTNILFRTGTSSTERARIDSSGNLLVGTTTNPGGGAYQTVISQESYDGLYVSVNQSPGGHTIRANRLGDGDVIQIHRSGVQVGVISVASSSTSYTTSSDYRLKEDIAPMTGALAKVAALKPCTYKWKVDGSDGQGFIAHELAEVEAGCVTGEKDATDADGNPQYQGIDTSFLIATLSAAIQELHALVKTQAERITALEGTAA